MFKLAIAIFSHMSLVLTLLLKKCQEFKNCMLNGTPKIKIYRNNYAPLKTFKVFLFFFLNWCILGIITQ